MKRKLVIFCFFLLCFSCEEPIGTPKPRAYPRVEYPEKKYLAFDKDYCQFTFQYPAYAKIQQDTAFFDEKPTHPCWFDIYMPDFDCRVHCSYSPIGEPKSFEELKEENFELVDWHTKRANYIDEIPVKRPNKVSGFAFIIEGPAASPFQFFLTDSTNHFMRGSLYFFTKPNPDSLAPVVNFVREDLFRMIETFEWKKASE